MLREFADAVLERLKAIGALASQWVGWAVVAAVAIGILLIALYAIDRGAFDRLAERTRSALGKGLGWTVLLLGTWFLGSLLLDLRDIHIAALAAQSEATVVSSDDPDAPEILQSGPAAAYLQEKTYTRTLTLPPSFLDRIGADGIGILSPYLQDPTAENVKELVDTFRRSGQDVVFTRQVKKLEETPLRIKNGDVRVSLAFLDSGTAAHRSTYRASFEGSYEFGNPLAEEVPVRFTFALPEGANRVRGFELSVSGNRITEPDEHGSYVWEGKLAAGASVKAQIKYETLGGGHWSYDVGSGRRRIEHFKLVMSADRSPRFSRTGIFPTTRSGNTMTWQLDDVITSQRIYVGFPHSEATEILTQAWTLFPFALLALVGFSALASIRSGSANGVWGLLARVGLMALAFGLTAAVAGALSVTLTLVLACALAAIFGAIGAPRGLLASVPAALVPLTALSATYTGVLLAVVLLGGAAAVWRNVKSASS